MPLPDWLTVLLFAAVLVAATPPLGGFMARLFAGERTLLSPVLAPVERGFYRLAGVDPAAEQRWTGYALALLIFNLLGAALLYALQRVQGALPLNPEGLPGVEPGSAFNTAVSFVSNTNWQGYAGETTMSHLTQMSGLAVQNFVSAATGIAVAVALARGLARTSANGIGNFWVDLTRATLYLLLPLSLAFALVLVARGVPQTLAGFVPATLLDGTTARIPVGPVASQEAIKLLGTNGGGFFNANSAHPFENPTPLTNFLQVVSIFLIPAALTNTFGRMVGSQRQGWAIFAAMAVLFAAGLAVTAAGEAGGNPLLAALGAEGGNLEGKEARFGVLGSALFAVVTTAASCGAVNAMHAAFMPLSAIPLLANMGVGEVVFGGVGAGLYGMLVYAVLAVFIAGLMVGRTPEYLGKKIGGFEVRMAMIVVLVPPLFILGGTALAAAIEPGLASRLNPAARGLAEILYAFTSAAANNGSAFAGLSANTPFYNLALGLAMFAGRFFPIVFVVALAGALAARQRVAATSGTFPTTGPLWVGLLAGVVLVVGALTFFPAYALGPVVEHFQLAAGETFVR